MNRGEANAVTTLSEYLLQRGVLDRRVPTPREACDALVELLARAEKTQQMALAPDDLPQRWDTLTGLLSGPGLQEWAVRWRCDSDGDPVDDIELCHDEATARALAARYHDWDPQVLHRSVTRGPWQPTP